jgi:hypothetical protein
MVASVAGFAATPVARVISSDAVEVDGITSPARNYVPVGIGGEISTHSSTAVIQFSDGTSVVLQPNSQLKIDGRAGHPEVRIIKGAADYKMKASGISSVSVGGARMAGKYLDAATAQASVFSSPTNPIAEALSSRVSSTGATAITPSSPIVTGGFSSAAPTLSGVFKVNDPTGGTSIVTPSGITINLTAGPVVNGVPTYTIASITENVTVSETYTPAGSTTPITVSVTTPVTVPAPAALSSAVITVTPPSSGSGSTQSTVAINTATTTTVGGVTTTTLAPVSTTTLATASTQISTTAASTAVTQVTATGSSTPLPTPPAGATVTVPVTGTPASASPVATATFSSSAS